MIRHPWARGLAAAAVVWSLNAGASSPVGHYDAHYAQDRAQIEDLLSRYTFALDWQEAATYAGCFTVDGVLDWAGGVVTGRAAIEKEAQGMRANFARKEAADAPTRPAALRHFITSLVLNVDGDHATGVAYWFEFDNGNRERWPMASGYGHSEDEYRKVNGQWLIARRKIFNEVMPSRSASAKDPAP